MLSGHTTALVCLQGDQGTRDEEAQDPQAQEDRPRQGQGSQQAQPQEEVKGGFTFFLPSSTVTIFQPKREVPEERHRHQQGCPGQGQGSPLLLQAGQRGAGREDREKARGCRHQEVRCFKEH